MSANENTDRFLLALGAFTGFGATFFASLSAGDDVSTALLKSAVGMIVGAALVKVLIAVAHSAFREAAMEKKTAKAPSQESEKRVETGAQPTAAAAMESPASSPAASVSLPETAAATPANQNASTVPVAAPAPPAAATRIRPARAARRVAS